MWSPWWSVRQASSYNATHRHHNINNTRLRFVHTFSTVFRSTFEHSAGWSPLNACNMKYNANVQQNYILTPFQRTWGRVAERKGGWGKHDAAKASQSVDDDDHLGSNAPQTAHTVRCNLFRFCSPHHPPHITPSAVVVATRTPDAFAHIAHKLCMRPRRRRHVCRRRRR